MADKVQKGTTFLKTHTAEQIAELMASGHPPFHEEVKCDETSCKECWMAWLNTGKPPKK